MKGFNLLLTAIAVLLLFSCTKPADNPVPTSQMFGALNTTETSLLGTWYLQKQVIASAGSVITYTGYRHQYNYISLMYGDFSPEYPKVKCKSYIGTWLPNAIIYPYDSTQAMSAMPVIYGGVPSSIQNGKVVYNYKARSDFWYYDNLATLLTIGGASCLISQSGGVLTVTYADDRRTIVSTLQQ